MLRLLLLLLFTTTFIGCKLDRKLIKEPIKPKEDGLVYAFDNLKQNEVAFETLNIRFSASITINKKTNNFNGQIRILKDSIIWMSITPALGIELARVYITPDTIKLINRLDSEYFTGTFDFLNSMFKTSIDYDILQAYLIGNDFSYYENNKFKITVNNMQYLLSTVGRHKLRKAERENIDKNKVMLQNIWLDPRTYKITKMMLKELEENKRLESSYLEFNIFNNQLFPTNISIDICSQNDKIKLNLNYSKVTIDENINFPFTIPAKYQNIK